MFRRGIVGRMGRAGVRPVGTGVSSGELSELIPFWFNEPWREMWLHIASAIVLCSALGVDSSAEVEGVSARKSYRGLPSPTCRWAVRKRCSRSEVCAWVWITGVRCVSFTLRADVGLARWALGAWHRCLAWQAVACGCDWPYKCAQVLASGALAADKSSTGNPETAPACRGIPDAATPEDSDTCHWLGDRDRRSITANRVKVETSVAQELRVARA